jgi:polyphosphate kinase
MTEPRADARADLGAGAEARATPDADGRAGARMASAALRAQTLPTLLNRERAIFEFNRRVLAQARRADVPLLERLRYVCIVSSNMDEFFEVRYADTMEAARRPGSGVSGRDLESIAADAHALIDDQYAAFNDDVMPALEQHGIRILNHSHRDEAQRRWVGQFFQRQVRPLLVPVGLDPSHPFPQVANKSLNFIARLGGKDAFGRENPFAIVKVPRVLPRVIRLPSCFRAARSRCSRSSASRAIPISRSTPTTSPICARRCVPG